MTDQKQMIDLLSQLLIQLSSQDNKLRNEAEQQLDQHWVVNQPAHLLVGLSHLIVSHPDAYVRKILFFMLCLASFIRCYFTTKI